MTTGLPDATIGDLVPLLYRARWAGSACPVRSRAGISGAGPICDGVSGSVPFPELMNSSWMLAEYDLRVTGQSEHLGRSACAIAGSPRLASERAHRAAAAAAADSVSALVDAELGILLRCEKVSLRRTEAAEFTGLTVDPADSADQRLSTRQPAHEQDHDELRPAPVPAGGRRCLGRRRQRRASATIR